MPVGRSSVVMCDDSVCNVGSMNLVALCGISILRRCTGCVSESLALPLAKFIIVLVSTLLDVM